MHSHPSPVHRSHERKPLDPARAAAAQAEFRRQQAQRAWKKPWLHHDDA